MAGHPAPSAEGASFASCARHCRQCEQRSVIQSRRRLSRGTSEPRMALSSRLVRLRQALASRGYFRRNFGGKAATSSGSAVRILWAASTCAKNCADRSPLGRFGQIGCTISSSATTDASARKKASPSSRGRDLIHACATIRKPAHSALGGYRLGSASLSSIYAPRYSTFPKRNRSTRYAGKASPASPTSGRSQSASDLDLGPVGEA